MARPSQYTASEPEEAGPEMERRPPVQRGGRSFDLEGSVGLLRDAVIFFGIISYFVGWIYLNEYLRVFGLYLANLEVPIHYVFVFSYAPLLDILYEPTFWGVMKLIFLLLIIFISIAVYRSSLMIRYGVILLGFLFILLVTFQMARETGRLHAIHVLDGGGQVIRFAFADGITADHEEEMVSRLHFWNSLKEDDCLRVVWTAAKAVYVANLCDKKKPTYRVPISSFLVSETYPSISSVRGQ